ncbi:MAG: UDP-glucose 4-epimerase GalE [Defluviitaleaceae bacterium]|nr:UDP-glucose 4-epimerase GalE [Defluviitaleaceae bacterium]
MKVLVTGGAGYIGSHTCIELIKNGYEIVVVDNFVNSHPKAVERVKKITGVDFPFYDMDLLDAPALDNVCKAHKIDCIVHFAGLKAVGESVAKPLEYYENNLCSTMNLLKTMADYDIRHMVFSSSATVYSGDNPMPLTEDSNRGCINPYGWTKYMCEQIISDWVAAKENASAVLLRYFNPIGAHESGLIGDDPAGIPNNLLPYITQAAAGKLPELPVTGADYDTPDGTGIRDYLHVTDLAAGHVAAIKFAEKNKNAHAFNLGTGKGVSVFEMIHAFEKVNGVKVPYRVVDRRPGDQPVSFADPSKATKLLNWQTEKSLEEALGDMWRWQTNNPNGYTG